MSLERDEKNVVLGTNFGHLDVDARARSGRSEEDFHRRIYTHIYINSAFEDVLK